MLVDGSMDVDIPYGISFADGVMVIPCLGVSDFARGPKALEWALAFRDGKIVLIPGLNP